MKNRYIIDGDTTKIFIQDSQDKEFVTLIDTEDLPKLQVFDGMFYAYYCQPSNTYYSFETCKTFICQCASKSYHYISTIEKTIDSIDGLFLLI